MAAKFTHEQLGAFSVSPLGTYEIATHQTFVLKVTVGTLGMDDKASVRFVFHGAKDYCEPQTSDPAGPGYVTAATSNGAPLEIFWAPFLNERPWYNTLEVRLTEGGLSPGDEIIVVLGDRSAGGPGFRLQTNCQDRFKFRALINPCSTQQFFPMAEIPTIEIGPAVGHTWMAVLPTLRQPDQPFRLCVKCEDIWGNPSNRVEQTIRFRSSQPIEGLPRTANFSSGDFSLVIDSLTSPPAESLTIDILDQAGNHLCSSNPMRLSAKADDLQYWGDLHGQSEETIGTNSAWRYFEFARDKAFVDIASHQGNDFQIDDSFWAELNAITAEFDEPDRFVAIPGYEWSGNSQVGGDRNIWFRNEGRSIRRAHRALITDGADDGTDCNTANALFKALVDSNEDVAVAAHCGGRFADIVLAHDGRVENSVEIHSAWGTFEWILRDAFDKGYRIGIGANSDGHKGRPGASYPGNSFFTSKGGLTCFQMPALNRDTLFEAIRRRHHYATTGTRLFLSARAEFEEAARIFHRDPAVFGPEAGFDLAKHAVMGDIVAAGPASARVRFCVDISAESPIERIDIFDGPTLLETVHPNRPGEHLSRRLRIIWRRARYRGRGRNLSWNGRITANGNSFESFQPINFWSPDNQPMQAEDGSVAFNGLTAGNLQGLDLICAQAESGQIIFESNRGNLTFQMDGTDGDELSAVVDGLDAGISISRMAENATVRNLNLQREFDIATTGDTRLYVRVTQLDGHQAWTSPIYIFRNPN